jgi:hypothetical protein
MTKFADEMKDIAPNESDKIESSLVMLLDEHKIEDMD